MISVKRTPIDLIRGNTMAFNLEFLDLNQDLDACFFSVKKNPNDDDYVLQKSLSDGITKVGENLYSVRIAPADTENLDFGDYWYDLVIGVNDDVYTIISGILSLKINITEGA